MTNTENISSKQWKVKLGPKGPFLLTLDNKDYIIVHITSLKDYHDFSNETRTSKKTRLAWKKI